MIECLNSLRELSVFSIFFRFLLATGCSAVIGYERSKSCHAAGLRTHIVVCIGAASVMLLSQYLSIYTNSNADPARLGAQVISGIGFLGAGTIVITGHQRGQRVKGLTTAAGLWASACMGLLIGGGFYEAAVIMCAFLVCDRRAEPTGRKIPEQFHGDAALYRVRCRNAVFFDSRRAAEKGLAFSAS